MTSNLAADFSQATEEWLWYHINMGILEFFERIKVFGQKAYISYFISVFEGNIQPK